MADYTFESAHVVTPVEAVFSPAAVSHASAANLAPLEAGVGGANVVYVMSARVTSTTTYVTWRSLNAPDPSAALAFAATGFAAAQLTDVKIDARMVR